ncbi:MAG: hypothetical protein AAGU27_09770 [Dehalobacterium sp.]
MVTSKCPKMILVLKDTTLIFFLTVTLLTFAVGCATLGQPVQMQNKSLQNKQGNQKQEKPWQVNEVRTYKYETGQYKEIIMCAKYNVPIEIKCCPKTINLKLNTWMANSSIDTNGEERMDVVIKGNIENNTDKILSNVDVIIRGYINNKKILNDSQLLVHSMDMLDPGTNKDLLVNLSKDYYYLPFPDKFVVEIKTVSVK